ncbi:right-handed parallel beta-helix repeat-containing protein [Listeria grandensis]|uniref:right-handed parallel beta-helix repeat-containing protein n=1 Tax=Listeria grandensis TaxID=1494963 RepID=UPI00164D0F44|nr:right-handed parallel beta-helix repeat-containing protein [Listeria grandensis]MBC6314489.1 right-handed parallel beta-helix repeat-containing protein [Listeria grandensis]
MKKLLFTLLIVALCSVYVKEVQAVSEAKTIDMSEIVIANNRGLADQNASRWNELMRKLDSTQHTTIYVPKGVYYFSQTLGIPSNVTVTGEKNAEGVSESSLVFTQVVRGIATRFPLNEMKAHTISLENLQISYTDDASDERSGTLIDFGAGYEEKNYEDYQVLDTLNIENCVIDAKKKGNSTVYLGRVTNATITHNIIKNSGLQNGIGLEFSKNVRIYDNDLSDLGRSGIQMYKFNGSKAEPIVIEKNRITNWMQRYGYAHFKTKYEAGIPVDVMNDSGIDSYGPQNENFIIKDNVLTAGRVNSENPNNTKIRMDYSEEVYPENMIFYTGIRLCGVMDALVTGNQVDLKGRDIFTMVYINSREKEDSTGIISTKPSNISIDQNKFQAEGNVRYPVRIFEGDVATNDKEKGISFTKNDFLVEGKLVNNGYYSFFTISSATKRLLLIGNTITMGTRMDHLVSVSDVAYNGTQVKLDELVAVNNTRNSALENTVRGNIGTTDYAYFVQDKPLFTNTNLYTGQYREPIWKIRLLKNSQVVKQADTDVVTKTYTFKGLDTLVVNDGSKYELVGVNESYKEVIRIPLTVRSMLDVPAYIIGTNEYTGTYGSTITRVRLFKDNVVIKQADTDGENYVLKEMRRLIQNDGSKYEMVGLDKNFAEVIRVPLEVKSVLDVPEYTVGQKEFSGGYRDNIRVVRLMKDGKAVKQADIDATTQKYILKGLENIILADGAKYEVVGFDATYKEVVRIDLKVNVLKVGVTQNVYTLGTSENKGSYEGPILRVRLLKNNVPVKQADMDQVSQTYVLKGLDAIVKNDGSKYELVGIDEYFKEIVRVDFVVGGL